MKTTIIGDIAGIHIEINEEGGEKTAFVGRKNGRQKVEIMDLIELVEWLSANLGIVAVAPVPTFVPAPPAPVAVKPTAKGTSLEDRVAEESIMAGVPIEADHTPSGPPTDFEQALREDSTSFKEVPLQL